MTLGRCRTAVGGLASGAELTWLTASEAIRKYENMDFMKEIGNSERDRFSIILYSITAQPVVSRSEEKCFKDVHFYYHSTRTVNPAFRDVRATFARSAASHVPKFRNLSK